MQKISSNEFKKLAIDLIDSITTEEHVLDLNLVDQYWRVTPPDSHSFECEPSLEVGSLIDDWQNLNRITEYQSADYICLESLAFLLLGISASMQKQQ